MSDVPFTYICLTLIAAIAGAAAVLVCRLQLERRGLQRTLAGWLILLIFFSCYFAKYYLLVLAPNSLQYLPLPTATDPEVLSPDNLLRTYALTTLGFAAACLAICIYQAKRRWWTVEPIGGLSKTSALFACVTGLLLSAVTGVLVFSHNMVMGAEAEHMAYHFRGVILLSRSLLIPMLLLLVAQYAMEQDSRRTITIGALLLIVGYGFSNAVLQGTKGGVGHLLLMAAMLPITMGFRVKGSYVAAAAAALFFSVALFFPLMGLYRTARSAGITIAESVQMTRSVKLDPSAPLKSVLMRLTGSDAFAVLLSLQPKVLGGDLVRVALKYPHGIGGYITEQVLDVPPVLAESGRWSVAPSVLGYFYVLGGALGLFLGLFFFSWGVLRLWDFILDCKFTSAPVALAALFDLLLQAMTDGEIGLFLRSQLPFFLFSLMVVEAISRIGRRQAPAAPAGEFFSEDTRMI